MIRRREFLKALAAGAAAAMSVRCGGGAAAPRVFRMNLASEPPTLDPNLCTDNVSLRALTNLMEGLTAYDADLRTIPAAAERWETLDGGRRVRFHLRSDGRWSDGRPDIRGGAGLIGRSGRWRRRRPAWVAAAAVGVRGAGARRPG